MTGRRISGWTLITLAAAALLVAGVWVALALATPGAEAQSGRAGARSTT